MNFKKPALKFVGQKLTEFPGEIFSSPRVYKLNLSHNSIKEIPKEIFKLKYLETLDISGNQIRILKSKLFELPNLKILILNDNKIVNLPPQIEKVQQLKILSLSNNNLAKLPFELTHLKSLEELNLSGNQLNDIPLHIGQPYIKLRALWLGNNPLKEFTGSRLLDGTPNLKAFYCYSPKLEKPVISADPVILKAARSKGNCLPYLKEMLTNNTPLAKINNVLSNVEPEIGRKPGRIFISYSHDDKPYLKNLQDNLKVLKRHLKGEIEFDYWDDARIRTGDKWKEEIEKALDVTSHAILLISTAFLASDFINDYELPALLKAAGEKGTRILPVLVKPSRFFEDPILSEFQAVNSHEEILSKSPEHIQDQIWVNLCNDIEYHLKNQF